MSGSRTRPRVVRQLRLDGTVSLIELHGTGRRTRTNTTTHPTLFAATRAMAQECRFAGAEPVRFTTGASASRRSLAPTRRGRAT